MLKLWNCGATLKDYCEVTMGNTVLGDRKPGFIVASTIFDPSAPEDAIDDPKCFRDEDTAFDEFMRRIKLIGKRGIIGPDAHTLRSKLFGV